MRIAIMDLGTNTFHLLIVEKNGSGYKEVLKRVDAVRLGEGGMSSGGILSNAFERGLQMMGLYAGLINDAGVKQVRAIATSALRSANNGAHFISQVLERTGILIELITGEQEAALIYKGVLSSGCLTSQSSLIMDIGGGSIEFIICNKEKIFWKQSFEIGAARLMERFHQTDPIPQESVELLYSYLAEKLAPLFEAVKIYPVQQLVGSSGAFESFAELADSSFDINRDHVYNFDYEQLLSVLKWIRLSSHSERANKNEIVPVRVDMLVTASLVTSYIINKLSISNISMTTSSLKEGAAAELLA